MFSLITRPTCLEQNEKRLNISCICILILPSFIADREVHMVGPLKVLSVSDRLIYYLSKARTGKLCDLGLWINLYVVFLVSLKLHINDAFNFIKFISNQDLNEFTWRNWERKAVKTNIPWITGTVLPVLFLRKENS